MKRRKRPSAAVNPTLPIFLPTGSHPPSPHALQILRESNPGCLANAALLRAKLHCDPISSLRSAALSTWTLKMKSWAGSVQSDFCVRGGKRAGFESGPSHPLFAPASSQYQESLSAKSFCSTGSLYEIHPPGSDELFSLRLESLITLQGKWHQPLFSQFYL